MQTYVNQSSRIHPNISNYMNRHHLKSSYTSRKKNQEISSYVTLNHTEHLAVGFYTSTSLPTVTTRRLGPGRSRRTKWYASRSTRVLGCGGRGVDRWRYIIPSLMLKTHLETLVESGFSMGPFMGCLILGRCGLSSFSTHTRYEKYWPWILGQSAAGGFGWIWVGVVFRFFLAAITLENPQCRGIP